VEALEQQTVHLHLLAVVFFQMELLLLVAVLALMVGAMPIPMVVLVAVEEWRHQIQKVLVSQHRAMMVAQD